MNAAIKILVKGPQQYGTGQSWNFISMSIYHISDANYIGRADPLVTEGTFLLEADRYWMPNEDHRPITMKHSGPSEVTGSSRADT